VANQKPKLSHKTKKKNNNTGFRNKLMRFWKKREDSRKSSKDKMEAANLKYVQKQNENQAQIDSRNTELE
jgi:hypothetical protein